VAKLLHYQAIGEGPVTVYLHGFLESSTMWEPLNLANIPGTHLLIDLPGHGNSPLDDTVNEPSIRFMADEVEKVLVHLNIQDYRIVGHSMGGYVAIALLAHAACKPSRVTLLNSNYWSDSEAKQADRVRVARIAYSGKQLFINEAIPNLFVDPAAFKEQITALKREAETMTADAIAYAALAMRSRTDYTELVAHIPTRIQIIHGALDRLVSVEELQDRLTALNGTTLPKVVIIPHAGHMAHWEATREVHIALFSSFNSWVRV
jgi:pimeloyl-ACP methyl ester carboxylesterase